MLVILAAALVASAPPDALLSPDPALTPGVWRDISLEQVCNTKWGKDHRFVTAGMKAQVFARYGFTGNRDPRCDNPASKLRRCEIDHARPRELGGADDVANLWVEPYRGSWGATAKDRLENLAHARACDKTNPLPLNVVRSWFEGDWRDAYRAQFGEPDTTVAAK